MDDRLKETLSAMMDDEADELSVRRLLSHAEQDQVRSQWQRWQQVRDLMHQGSVAPEAVDVSAGVRDVLDGSGAVSPAATVGSMPRRDKSWHWPAVAMVTLAAVIGFGAGAGWESAEDGGAIAAAGVSEEQDRRSSRCRRWHCKDLMRSNGNILAAIFLSTPNITA